MDTATEITHIKEEVSSEMPAIKQAEPKKLSQRIETAFLEIFAILVWGYVVIKVFFFDIDNWFLKNTAPQFTWVLDLKFFITIVAIAIAWLLLGNKKTIICFFYTLFYPLVLIFARIPYFVFKQKSWTFAFAIINSLISLFKSIKFNFIATAFFLGALVCILIFNNNYLLWLAILLLLVITTIVYIRKFWLALKPSEIFGLHIKFFKGIRRISNDTFTLDESIRNLPVASLDEQQLQKWTEKLQMSVLFNRVCLFAANKLRDYQNSGWQFVTSVFTILLLVVFTIISFSGINYGLFKLDPTLFSFTKSPNLFTFFYYSFSNLFFHSISELSPIAPLSQISFMVETLFEFILGGIFVTLYLSVKSEKNSIELGKAIDEIEKEGEAMEGYIRDEYKINSILEALTELEKLKAGMVSFLYWMSRGL